MDSRGNNIPFRSVPLIQRGDMTRFSSAPSAERVDATQRRRAPIEREDWAELREAEPLRTDESRRRRRSSDEPRSSRSLGNGQRRSRLGANATPEFGASRLPAGQHVSAHMGESGVVSVSRRSERRGGFTLVPDEPAPSRRAESRYDDTSYRMPHTSLVARDRDTLRRSSYVEEYDDYDAYDDYDELDFADEGPSLLVRGLSAVAGGVTAIPRAIAAGFMGLVSHVRLGGVIVLAVVAFCVFMLYAPVRDLYVASRRLEALQATYEELVAENEQITHELELLQTREGIENEARARGYVEPGEVKVKVNGLPEEEAFDGGAAVVAEDEYVDDRTWYVRFFDTLFGYEPEG